MRHICLGISKFKMSCCWPLEKDPLARGIPVGGFKGDQDLDNGQAQGEALAPFVGLESNQSDIEGVSGTSPPQFPSTGTSQRHN